ncbi:MAG: CTP synthase [Deltaproteobacteria bacterium CG2_30_63_29]|nr:MAG: CTP synthase [Deltaproteobacteria bacterium CG2_30_63_29]PIW01645.1 MAG: CTP synthetase [Deltaproteobacteria bacterium CG17_big_fil_post_rev_8_21_14_2_50_63_7]PJB44309.1 MAG: CTP synthetase [Deltaproteobacteria bacterium CG_4_9_14_3_um_filter_63_12]
MQPQKQTKFIFVTGGVISALGKGISAAAIGTLLELRGLKITFMKLDPYINVDPGTMSPFQHGEVYVTDDGAETDMDLGHYERFTSAKMGKHNNCTTGRIYYTVITKERQGEYLGATIQVIPHITDEIKATIHKATQGVDLAIIEVGGTVGDIESLPFLEAIRQLRSEVGRDDAVNIHVTLVPYIKTAGEVKTKPTQHSVAAMRQIGIQPDILLCRSEVEINDDLKRKIALFCNVPASCVFTARDAESIYLIPKMLHEEGLDHKLTELLNIWSREPDLSAWNTIEERLAHPGGEVTIAIVGKYVGLTDSYKSLNEALKHAGLGNDVNVKLEFVDSEKLEESGDAALFLAGVDGVLVPGGFGVRGTEGKIQAIQYARENRIPFLGICLGMQLAIVEFARHCCDLKQAESTEFDRNTPHPVVALMEEQKSVKTKGATMRLGAYPCVLAEGSKARAIYGVPKISERHRHRYEVNNDFRGALQAGGLALCGTSPDGKLVEMIEIPDHPWFLGCQFHPEYKSRPIAPHPLFSSFVKASHERALSKPSDKE